VGASRSIAWVVAIVLALSPLLVSAQVVQQPIINGPVARAPVFGPAGMPGFGGASMADFDSLMQLIASTVQPESWEDVGGPGAMSPFATGVYIDPDGTLQEAVRTASDDELSKLRRAVLLRSEGEDVNRNSVLRKISLPRLEKQLELRAAAGKGPTVEMGLLAGLRRIEYVFVYPETGDLVIAGPAGPWRLDEENRFLSTETGEPIVRLDDLVVVLRQMTSGRESSFGCLIVPTQEGLARVKAFAEESAKEPLKRGTRNAWLEQLREKLGKQKLEVYGIDPRTRVASVMLEADYRMKLVGMGLEPGVLGVKSYLQLAREDRSSQATMSVLRWWFTLNYDSVTATDSHNAFAFRGQGAQVLSENEMLEADGMRIHTGQSDALNRQFATSFTRHYDELCQRYPVYAELRNICDLALVGALVRREGLADTVQWPMLYFGDPKRCPVRLGPMPQTVDSVINDCSVGRGQFIVGVSGGVRIDPAYLLKTGGIRTDPGSKLSNTQSTAKPPAMEEARWWWD
jgi:uncharacterized protein DUF1598